MDIWDERERWTNEAGGVENVGDGESGELGKGSRRDIRRQYTVHTLVPIKALRRADTSDLWHVS